MARVYHRKARKDYPAHGIKKGDMYYTASIKTGARSSRTLRQKTPFKQSQLTVSEFKQAWYTAEEEYADIKPEDRSGEALEDIASQFEQIASECMEKFDNMPEGLQYGDTGQLLEERQAAAEEVQGELERIASEYDELSRDDYGSDDEFEDARESLWCEAEDALGQMPG